MPTLMLNDLVCFISRPSGVLGFPIIPSAVVMGCLFYKFRVVFVAIHLQLRISSPRRRRVLLSLLRPHMKFRVAVLQITRIFGRDFRKKQAPLLFTPSLSGVTSPQMPLRQRISPGMCLLWCLLRTLLCLAKFSSLPSLPSLLLPSLPPSCTQLLFFDYPHKTPAAYTQT